jgi:hypothetical protein
MNLIAEAEAPLEHKAVWFSLSIVVVGALTVLTVAVSRRLTSLFDWITGEPDGG